jgi:hypothetical protein
MNDWLYFIRIISFVLNSFHTFALKGRFLELALNSLLLFGFGIYNSNTCDFNLDLLIFDFAFAYYETNFENCRWPYCDVTLLNRFTKAFIYHYNYLIFIVDLGLKFFII